LNKKKAPRGLTGEAEDAVLNAPSLPRFARSRKGRTRHMPPLSLDDDEMNMVMALAAPLPAQNRVPFLEAIAAEIEANGAEVGPGAVHRIARSLQRRFVDLPQTIHANKYYR
jgi:hypothetical protein